MRQAIACAMLLAFFAPSASATDERGPRSSPAPASSSRSDSAATDTVALNAPPAAKADALAIALPEAPATTAIAPGVAPAASATIADPALPNDLALNTSLAPIHALLAPPTAFIKLKQPPRTHSFFDARNSLGFTALAASLTADALSTQKGLAYPGFHEMNPIARPFVQSRVGAAAYNAGSFGLLTGLMYVAHKTQHHKLERILPFAVGGWEGLLSARNYRVIANRAR